MIQSTFLHLPGVGHKTERKLWDNGFHNWEALWEELSSGRRISRLFRKQLLFPFAEDTHKPEEGVDERTIAWIDLLDQSMSALARREFGFFTDTLRPSDQWRLFPSVLEDALYLDIETTGLSRDHHYVTVVGAMFRNQLYQWVWPESPTAVRGLFDAASVVITFNGARFDLPFIRRQLPSIPIDVPHVDLLYVARAAGFKGGQKEIEHALGLKRPDEIRGLDGEAAAAAWCASLYGSAREYKLLLKYNRLDVAALPQLAVLLYRRLAAIHSLPFRGELRRPAVPVIGKKPQSFAALKQSWRQHRPHYNDLAIPADGDRVHARSVGIDLRATAERPTGWAICAGVQAVTKVLYSDEEILKETIAANPDVVSIDAPLFLPRGRQSTSDDSPCRPIGGIVRDAERILWARGIRVYPALIKQMQGLTSRGIRLASILREEGLTVIESYPGAAQDLLTIPRKGADMSLLAEGLKQFGYRFEGNITHDELDAITSALVGHYFMAGEFEAIGEPDEGFMIVPMAHRPRWNDSRPLPTRAVALVGLPGAGKSTLARQLATRLGWERISLGELLRKYAEKDGQLKQALEAGELAPEALVSRLVRTAIESAAGGQVILDGFPRHSGQVNLLRELEIDWSFIALGIDADTAITRIAGRKTCARCGSAGSAGDQLCGACGHSSWRTRGEDSPDVVRRRMLTAAEHLSAMLDVVESKRLMFVDANQPTRLVAKNVIMQLESHY